jgi:hypothetical protein
VSQGPGARPGVGHRIVELRGRDWRVLRVESSGHEHLAARQQRRRVPDPLTRHVGRRAPGVRRGIEQYRALEDGPEAGTIRAADHQHPAVGKQRRRGKQPGQRHRRASVAPRVGGRIVDLRRRRFGGLAATDDEHLAARQQCRGMVGECRRERSGAGPRVSRRVVELGGAYEGEALAGRAVAAGHQRLAIRQRGGRVVVLSSGERGGRQGRTRRRWGAERAEQCDSHRDRRGPCGRTAQWHLVLAGFQRHDRLLDW